jgi:deoxyadenosine/deoxycytidine kinase
MKTILITGLDGSGKSTLFHSLGKNASPDQAFLKVPHFELETLPPAFKYRNLCQRLNEMGTQADILQFPLLKIYALFGSMVLFSHIQQAFEKDEKKILFCERHPLIDAPIYVLAYLPLMDPNRWDKSVYEQIDASFSEELKVIFSLITNTEMRTSPSKSLLQFIHDLFQNGSKNQFRSVFSCELPTQLFFLDAPVTTLIQRLSNRELKEHHEEHSHLESMRNAYLNLLESIPQVTMIDASSFDQLDQLAIDLSSLS